MTTQLLIGPYQIKTPNFYGPGLHYRGAHHGGFANEACYEPAHHLILSSASKRLAKLQIVDID